MVSLCDAPGCNGRVTHRSQRQWGDYFLRFAVCEQHRPTIPSQLTKSRRCHVEGCSTLAIRFGPHAGTCEAHKRRSDPYGGKWTRTALEEALDTLRPPSFSLADMTMVEGPPPYLFLTKCQCHTCMVIYGHWGPQLGPLEALSQAGFRWDGFRWMCPKCVKQMRLTREARLRNLKELAINARNEQAWRTIHNASSVESCKEDC
jgi:hypothetical protein